MLLSEDEIKAIDVVEEEYEPIDGFEDYEISNHGNIRHWIIIDNGNTLCLKNLKLQENTHGYYRINLYKDNIRYARLIHRLVASKFILNSNNKLCVDHQDGNKLNNSIKNLRWCNYAENNMNRKKRDNTSSIYKGVCWHEQRGKWISSIQINGRTKHLGYFINEKEAAEAYNKAAIARDSNFARVNNLSD